MSEQPGTYNLIIRPLKINGKEKPDPDDYIWAFGRLPDIILKANGLLATDLNEGNLGVLLKSHRDAFLAMQQWIDCFKSNTSVPPELCCTWKRDYKPQAEWSWAVLELAREVLERDLWGWKRQMKSLSATEVWFSHEWERLEKSFQSSGILGKAVRTGKHETCDDYLKRINKNFETLHSREFASASDWPPDEVKQWDSTVEALRVHAEAIAKQDDDFRRRVYSPYITTQKRAIRTIRNNSNFQISNLNPDGSLDLGGKGKRGKNKKPSKS